MAQEGLQGRKAMLSGQLRKEAGQLLKSMRERKGLTQRELAEKVGFDYYTFIAQIEAGRGRIPADRYGAYARALDIPSREFVRTLLKYYDPLTYTYLFGAPVFDAPVFDDDQPEPAGSGGTGPC